MIWRDFVELSNHVSWLAIGQIAAVTVVLALIVTYMKRDG